ncbi:histidine kinase [Hymenobacter glaciei]|uniref:Histidine kinase n=1 Tax=Hymenobacter glaciei TaxID=877209 RepID=A0ABP7U2H2_9BACT
MRVSVARVRTVLVHLAVWLAYYTYETLFVLMMQAPLPGLLVSLLTWSMNAALVYLNALWLFPRLFARQRYLAYAGALLLLLAAYCLTRYGLIRYVLVYLEDKESHYDAPFKILAVQSIYRATFFLGFSMGYAYARHAIGLANRLRRQERSLLEADIAFLKSQINPHFLFNALNFLYAQVYPLSEPTAKSVLLLSDIMRYALNEGGEQGKVMLDKEVQHLRNYLALNRLRFGDQLQVEFDVTGSTDYLLVLPLVLLTFVENCFKHGELFDPAHPVRLRLTVRDNELELLTSNRKRTGPVEHSTGIGLENTRRRLDAVYPGRYELRVIDEPETYTVHLHLSL